MGGSSGTNLVVQVSHGLSVDSDGKVSHDLPGIATHLAIVKPSEQSDTFYWHQVQKDIRQAAFEPR
jgi:hypothetical protein